MAGTTKPRPKTVRHPKDPGTLDLVSGGALIGYGRVSTAEQSLDLQVDALRQAGCSPIYTDKASGIRKVSERPELSNALKALRAGDTLIIWRLDRLARSLSELFRIVDELKERKIALRSLTENIDTSTPTGEAFLGMLGVIAHFERALMIERTKEGMKAARARGRHGGRPRVLDDTQIAQLRSLAADPTITVTSICQQFEISRSTYYKHVGEKAPPPVAKPAARRKRK